MLSNDLFVNSMMIKEIEYNSLFLYFTSLDNCTLESLWIINMYIMNYIIIPIINVQLEIKLK